MVDRCVFIIMLLFRLFKTPAIVWHPRVTSTHSLFVQVPTVNLELTLLEESRMFRWLRSLTLMERYIDGYTLSLF